MQHFQFDINKYLNELEMLVNIDSGSYDVDGVKKIAAYFESLYKELGWTVKYLDFDDRVGPCLEIRNTANEKIDILLTGHMDTVFPNGTSALRPFSIKNNRAYGPGVADMKSGLLSIYYAVKELNFDNFIKIPSICIALNSHEEISSAYSYEWIQQLATKSSYAFVLEPARKNGDLIRARKGILKYSLDLTGISAHAGVEPEKGISAITELGYWIMKLDQLTNYEMGTTLNVGLISGGTAANVVAEHASAVIDVRYTRVSEMKKLDEMFNHIQQHATAKGIISKINRVGFRPPMNPSEKGEDLIALANNIGKKLNIEFGWASTGGGSDANFISAEGVPTIDALGPIGGGTHGIDEYIELNSIEPRINLLREILLEVICNKLNTHS
ncbi:MAG: M20 family metallopeptidase [Tissierellales bacterium]|nr:M20 family metallopeptidase [Tissierellales bacterium]MBN2827773.1 M20 family metallopeptidase [Tissierellales bacterium]